MSHAIIFGAGRVGRGLLAEVFQQAGCSITFVEKNINLVDALNRSKSYAIHKTLGALTDTVPIYGIDALHTSDEGAIVDLLCTRGAYAAVAVSPFSLAEIADILAVAIARRALEMPNDPLDILLCDNSADPVSRFHDVLAGLLGGAALEYFKNKVGLVRTIVLRLSSDLPPDENDPLAVLNNGYAEMPVDAAAFKGKIPNSTILRPTNTFQAESARKIYMVNMVQAAMAYLGVPLGLSKVTQAIVHPHVRPYLKQALEEAAYGLCGEYGFTPRHMDEWQARTLSALENPALDDTLERLGADAARKVGRHERLVGAAILCQKFGRQPHAISRAIAYAYVYLADDPGTRRLASAIAEDGIEIALERFSGIDYRNPLRVLILDEYERALAFMEKNK